MDNKIFNPPWSVCLRIGSDQIYGSTDFLCTPRRSTINYVRQWSKNYCGGNNKNSSLIRQRQVADLASTPCFCNQRITFFVREKPETFQPSLFSTFQQVFSLPLEYKTKMSPFLFNRKVLLPCLMGLIGLWWEACWSFFLCIFLGFGSDLEAADAITVNRYNLNIGSPP